MSLSAFKNDGAWFKKHISAIGLSSSRPVIPNPKNEKEDELNQRVEFKIVTNASEQLDELSTKK
ncbi:MAG: hypothetical protein B7X52_01040 [Thiotrichales bacterium 34-46-19]|nr:MAG: hypothetical protein B7X52_01040 [Thiotrichales bacterium 34-46-19]